ncbi:MAG: tetratricopeptide repeat protein [Deltaproteobacteria bacterium]|nr:tetratricopeptide repeat protein [Deltaproteobacteria bacterium]
MADKMTRKQLKQPDEFVSFFQRSVTWLDENKILVTTLVLACALVVVGVFGFRWYFEAAEEKASMAFMSAHKIYTAKVTPNPEADESATQADGTYPSEEAKYRAALDAFEGVRKLHSGSKTSSLATYFIAECQRRLGMHAEAVESFEAYLREEGPKAPLAPFAIEGIGATLESQGELDKARKHYRRLTEKPFEHNDDRGLYHLARLEQKSGNGQKAAALFAEILQKHPDSPLLQDVQDRLSMLPEVPEVAKAPEAIEETEKN